MPKLTSLLATSVKQKMLPAIIIDVLGFKCSVRISTNGKKLTGLSYVGDIPDVGDNVLVDYRNATVPIVITSTGGKSTNYVPPAPEVVTSSTPPEEQPVLGGGGSGGIQFPEADGNYYAVKDAAWIELPSMAPDTTAQNDFQLGDGSGNWIKKTLAETQEILGTLPTKRIVQLKVFSDETTIATGDSKLIFCVPAEFSGYNIYEVDAFISTVSSSGLVNVQIRNITQAADVLSTALTIDEGEYTSYSAATPAVIDTANDDVAQGDLLAIDVDGAGTGAKGLGVSIVFKLPYETAEYIYAKKTIQLKIYDDETSVATGDGKHIFCIPSELNGFNLVDVNAFVTTVSSSGVITVQIRNATDSADMLTTASTIDASEYTSYTAATPKVIDTTKDDVVSGDLLAIDVDTAGTGAKGLGVILTFQLPQ